MNFGIHKFFDKFYHPVSKVSREVANITERQIPPPLNGVKELVCLSVRLLQTLTSIISGLAELF